MKSTFVVLHKCGKTIPNEESDPIVNVKPMFPTGVYPKDEDLDDHDKKILVLQEAADKHGKLLPTIYNGRVSGKKTNTDPDVKGIRPLLSNFKY